MLDHVARLPRSGFDMSQSFAFTASTGMILPVYADFLTSSERVTISTDFFARTQPLVTAAMADVDIYLDWFFVPMTMLYTPWGQIRWQTNDFLSSAVMDSTTDVVGSPGRQGGFPLLNVGETLNAYNADSSLSYNRNAFFSINPASMQSSEAYFFNAQFDCQGKSLYRMADMLGFNPSAVFAQDPNKLGANNYVSWNPNVFPWKALSYQCLYQNWYRNDDYEVRDVKSYNWDYLYSETQSASFAGNPRNPFILRYADYRRDYFMSVKPSPISSGINFLGGNSSIVLERINNYLQSSSLRNVSDFSNPSSITPSVGDLNSGSLSSGTTQFGTAQQISSNQSYILTGQLRSLFAVEKLLRITGRAAKTYDAQTLAHFGFKVPHDVKHDITHLHTSHGMLHIGEVIGTADTFNGSTGSALGEIAGKGYVSIHDGKKVKFTAPVDGALMCCFRAIPRLRVGFGFDKQNAIADRLDLFIPEYDKLGMQPMYRYEFRPYTDGVTSALPTDTFGWQLRYQQFKQKFDRVSAAFTAVGYSPAVNQYESWVLSYNPFTYQTNPFDASVARAFKCPPTALNSIMVVPYTPSVSANFPESPWAEFYTDPFICDFKANVKKVSPMSPTGEPDMVSL